MQPELEQLLILQDRAQKIRQVEAELKSLPQERKSLDAQKAAAAAALEATKDRARHIEMEKKKLELDVGTRNESIARLKTQQYETRKNDEFSAMGHEIERYQKEISALEDQELELMEQADSPESADRGGGKAECRGQGIDRAAGGGSRSKTVGADASGSRVKEGTRRFGRESG